MGVGGASAGDHAWLLIPKVGSSLIPQASLSSSPPKKRGSQTPAKVSHLQARYPTGDMPWVLPAGLHPRGPTPGHQLGRGSAPGYQT